MARVNTNRHCVRKIVAKNCEEIMQDDQKSPDKNHSDI